MEILTKRDKTLLRLLRSKLNKEDIAKIRNLYSAKGGKAARGAVRAKTGLTVPARVLRALAGIARNDQLDVYKTAWHEVGYARVRPYVLVFGSYRRGRGGGRQDLEARRVWAAPRGER